jgi:hypothetical protein
MAADWSAWRDTLIFREELRAIGESMIESRASGRSIMGYGRFVDLLNDDGQNSIVTWSKVVFNFLLDQEDTNKDFRKLRLQRVLQHLIDFIELIDKRGIDARLKDARKRWKAA